MCWLARATHRFGHMVSYINLQGGLRLCPLYKLARQILLWAQGKLLSLRAVYIPGHLNQGADILLRQGPSNGLVCISRDLTLSPVVLPHESSSTWAGCHRTNVAEALSVCLSPDCFAPRSYGESFPVQGSSSVSSPVLARPAMVCGPGSPSRSLSVGDSH